MYPGKLGSKPAIVISKTYDVYLGNLGTEDLELSAGELFGFNVGAFEMKIINGLLLSQHKQLFGLLVDVSFWLGFSFVWVFFCLSLFGGH